MLPLNSVNPKIIFTILFILFSFCGSYLKFLFFGRYYYLYLLCNLDMLFVIMIILFLLLINIALDFSYKLINNIGFFFVFL